MGTSEAKEAGAHRGIQHTATMLRAAANARKCWACGCLRHALDTIDHALLPPGWNDALNVALASARERLQPQRYECLGGDICFPADRLERFRRGTARSIWLKAPPALRMLSSPATVGHRYPAHTRFCGITRLSRYAPSTMRHWQKPWQPRGFLNWPSSER